MDKKKTILYVQAFLCILWVLLMSESVVDMFQQGTAYQAQGHPEVWIFTREKVVTVFLRYLPLLLLALAVNMAALFMGIRDEDKDKPQALSGLMEIYKKERAEARRMEPDPVKKAEPTGKRTEEEERVHIAGADRKLRTALFILAAFFVVAGILNGSLEDMLIKAIHICSECIGLG